MQSDGPAAVDWIISGSEVLKNQFAGTSGDVVVVSKDPAATRALWLPRRLKEGLELADDSKHQVEKSRTRKNDPFGVQDSVQKWDSENSQTNKIRADDLDVFAKWIEFPVKIWQAKFDLLGKKSAGGTAPLPAEEDTPNMDDVEALVQRRVGPVIRTKVEFSKGTDGSQRMSYEEEVLRKQEAEEGDCGMTKRGRRGLRSMFLDLIG